MNIPRPSSSHAPPPPSQHSAPSSPVSDAPEPETGHRPDSVRFRPVLSGSSAISQPSPLNQEPSFSNPPPLWSRQPDESAVDYQLFAAWLQLPVPRPARKAAAAAIGCSLHRLNRLITRHRWKTRATAFDNHRANAASRALEALLSQETRDCHERARNFRLQEWLLHEHIIGAAMAAVDEFEKRSHRASLRDITRLIELASVLGRRAAGMPLDPGFAKPDLPSPYPDFEYCLRKIYGGAADAPASPNHATKNDMPKCERM